MKNLQENFPISYKKEESENANSLNRFIDAQESMYEIALGEIKNGKKLSHWIWYI